MRHKFERISYEKKITITIHDIAFELFAMHCGIGIGKRQKKIPQEK